MSSGTVVQIFIAPASSVPMQAVPHVRAVPGCGLEGDRYFNRTGTLIGGGRKAGKPMRADMEATLIESEALEALERDYSIRLGVDCSRRNLVTRGIALNHLVNREFTIGTVRMKGIKLCEPCGHLENLTQQGVRAGLIHRGGLRAQILTEGVIHAGDRIAPIPAEHAVPCAS